MRSHQAAERLSIVPQLPMDLVLNTADQYILTPYIYPSTWPEDSLTRQLLSLYVITVFGGYSLYLSLAFLSYIFIYDKNLTKHPQYLPNQVYLEITYTCRSVPLMAVLTVPLFLLEVSRWIVCYCYSVLYFSVCFSVFVYPAIRSSNALPPLSVST